MKRLTIAVSAVLSALCLGVLVALMFAEGPTNGDDAPPDVAADDSSLSSGKSLSAGKGLSDGFFGKSVAPPSVIYRDDRVSTGSDKLRDGGQSGDGRGLFDSGAKRAAQRQIGQADGTARAEAGRRGSRSGTGRDANAVLPEAGRSIDQKGRKSLSHGTDDSGAGPSRHTQDAADTPPDSLTEEQAAEGTDAGIVRGVVVDWRQTRVNDAEVTAYAPGQGVKRTVRTGGIDGEGAFQISRLPLPPAEIKLIAAKDSAVSEPVRTYASENPADAAPITLKLAVAGELRVSVQTDAGNAVAQARVHLQAGTDAESFPSRSTNSTGVAVFDRIPAGRFTVLAEKQGYSPAGYTDKAVSRKDVDVRAREKSRVELTLVKTQALRGVVLNAAGEPVAGAAVYERLTTPDGAVRRVHGSPVAYTDQQGEFTLQELPDGHVELCAVKRGTGLALWREVSAPEDIPVDGLTLVFEPAYQIRGVVVDAGHSVLPDAEVDCALLDNNYGFLASWSASRPRPDGSFLFAGIPAMACRLTAALPDGKSVAKSLTGADVRSPEPVTLKFDEDKTRILRGDVVSSNGQGLTGADIRVHAADGRVMKKTRTEGDGRFEVGLDENAPWLVSASVAGYAPRYRELSAQDVRQRVRFVMREGATLVVPYRTELAAAQVPADKQIAVRLALQELPVPPFVSERQVAMQPSGEAVFTHLVPGTYLCSLTGDGFAERTVKLNISAAKPGARMVSQPVALNLGATVYGTVLDENRDAVSGAVVRPEGHVRPRTTTADDGSFTLQGLAKGDVTLRAASSTLFGLSRTLELQSGSEYPVGTIILDRSREDVQKNRERFTITTGVAWQRRDDRWFAADVMPDTSASASRIRNGDRLLAVDGRRVSGWSREVLQNAVSGEPGTNVNLRLEHGAQPYEVELERRLYEIEE